MSLDDGIRLLRATVELDAARERQRNAARDATVRSTMESVERRLPEYVACAAKKHDVLVATRLPSGSDYVVGEVRKHNAVLKDKVPGHDLRMRLDKCHEGAPYRDQGLCLYMRLSKKLE